MWVFLALSLLLLPATIQAETETIEAEATYTMGDGETPSFAEEIVLKKAKQTALEQAGTYVESYTHVRNLDVTVDEIKTIAGGVLETKVLEKGRVLLKEGGERFYIKIRAQITTDKIADLARRLKGGSVAADYKRLQDDFAKLAKELEVLKRQVAEAKAEPEREIVLEKIRQVEKQFRQVRSTETALYKRLLSGEELSANTERAFQEAQKRREEERTQQGRQNHAFEQLLRTIRDNGHTIEIGQPETEVTLDRPENVTLRFLVTATVSDEVRAAVQDLQAVGVAKPVGVDNDRIQRLLDSLTLVVTVTLKEGRQYASRENEFHNFRSPRLYDLRFIVKEIPRAESFGVEIPRHAVGDVISIEGRISPDDMKPKRP